MPGRRPCSALRRSLAILAAALLGPAMAHGADGDPAAGKRAHVDRQVQTRDLTDDAISALATCFASRAGLFLR